MRRWSDKDGREWQGEALEGVESLKAVVVDTSVCFNSHGPGVFSAELKFARNHYSGFP